MTLSGFDDHTEARRIYFDIPGHKSSGGCQKIRVLWVGLILTVSRPLGKAIIFCPYRGAKMPQKQGVVDKIIKHRQQTRQFDEQVRQRKVQEKIEAEGREKKSTTKVLLGCVLVLIAIGVVVFFGIQGENNSEAELKALVSEIQNDLEAGNYDVALFKTEQLYWPHSDIDGQKRWNKQREGLIKVIKEAKEGAGKKLIFKS